MIAGARVRVCGGVRTSSCRRRNRLSASPAGDPSRIATSRRNFCSAAKTYTSTHAHMHTHPARTHAQTKGTFLFQTRRPCLKHATHTRARAPTHTHTHEWYVFTGGVFQRMGFRRR